MPCWALVSVSLEPAGPWRLLEAPAAGGWRESPLFWLRLDFLSASLRLSLATLRWRSGVRLRREAALSLSVLELSAAGPSAILTLDADRPRLPVRLSADGARRDPASEAAASTLMLPLR